MLLLVQVLSDGILLGTLVPYKDILLPATSRVIQNFTLVGLFCAKHFYGVSATVYRDPTRNTFKGYFGSNRVSNISWHSDISYEKQPLGTTLFFILDLVGHFSTCAFESPIHQPEVGGGDTLFLSQVKAYNRLSPEFQKRLEGLRTLHSAVDQAESSRKRNGPDRQEPV